MSCQERPALPRAMAASADVSQGEQGVMRSMEVVYPSPGMGLGTNGLPTVVVVQEKQGQKRGFVRALQRVDRGGAVPKGLADVRHGDSGAKKQAACQGAAPHRSPGTGHQRRRRPRDQ